MEIRKTSMNLRKNEDAALRGSVSALRFTGLATGAYAKTARKTAKQTVRSAGVLREAAEGRDLKAAKGGFTQADTERFRALSGRQRRRGIKAAEKAAREEAQKGAPTSKRPEIFAEELKKQSRKLLPVRYEAEAPVGETVREMRKALKKGETVKVTGFAKNERQAQKRVKAINNKYKNALKERNRQAGKRFASVASREILKEYRTVRQSEMMAAQAAMDERGNEAGVSSTVMRRATVVPRAVGKYQLRKAGDAVRGFIGRKLRDLGAALARMAPRFIRIGLVAFTPFLLIFVLALPLILLSGMFISGSAGGMTPPYASLDINGVYVTPLSYYTYYESGGRYDAVLGGRENGCFGAYQFHYRYELQPFIDYAVNKDPQKYHMLEPYTSSQCSRESLRANEGLASAWAAAYNAGREEFQKLQDDYVIETKWNPIVAYQEARGLHLNRRPDVVKGLVLSIHNRMGYETSQFSIIARSGVSDDTSNEDFIIRLCDTFGAACGGDIYERYCVDGSSAARGGICEKNMALNILHGEYVREIALDDANASLEADVFLTDVNGVACVKVGLHGRNRYTGEGQAYACDIVYGDGYDRTHDHCYLWSEGIWGSASVPGPTGKNYQIVVEHDGNLIGTWNNLRVSWWADGTVRAYLNGIQVFEDRGDMIPQLAAIEISAMNTGHSCVGYFQNVRAKYAYNGHYGTRGNWGSIGYYGLSSVQTSGGQVVESGPYCTNGYPSYGVSATMGGVVSGNGGVDWDHTMDLNDGHGVPISSYLQIGFNN